MPMIDFRCSQGHHFEAFFHPSQAATVEQYPCVCGSLGYRCHEILQAPAVVWTGPIGQRYRDKDKAGFHQPDGMVQYTRNTPDGKPRPVHLESWSDVKNFCKAEGCADPRSMGRNMTVGEDGKTLGYDKGATGTEV